MALNLLANGHFGIQSDQVTFIHLAAKDAAGNVVALPAGLTFGPVVTTGAFAASMTPAVAVMPAGSVDGAGLDISGQPALSLTSLVLNSNASNSGGGIGIDLTNSMGLPMFDTDLFDIVEDVAAVSVGLDNSNTATVPQTAPTAPGP
jgi:hypothetical protein